MNDEAYELMNEALRARDQFRIIASGQIQRANRKSQYEIGPPGMRKLNLKDAQGIAKIWEARLNAAVNKFCETNK